MSYIEFNNVVKRYGSGAAEIRALDGASFSVEKGELAVILGASGAGKTTALNILGGMDSATDGSVLIDGQDIARSSESQLGEYRRAAEITQRGDRRRVRVPVLQPSSQPYGA